MAAQIAASVAPCDAPDSEDEAVEDLFGFDFNGIVVCDDSEEESDGDCAPHVPSGASARRSRVDAASLAPGEFLERFSRRNAPVVLSNCEAYSLQIQGSKEFTLFPPDDVRYLYVNAQAGFSTTGRSASRPDVAKFPLFQLAARSTVTIGPGDALFVPDGWWHTARCVSEAPSVTLGGNFVGSVELRRSPTRRGLPRRQGAGVGRRVVAVTSVVAERWHRFNRFNLGGKHG
ncbi:SMART transcription factor jumonji [Aureococcus anophagefferens]|nr:SMART transcription factor jumonji [Aureococcus anophagefferens]